MKILHYVIGLLLLLLSLLPLVGCARTVTDKTVVLTAEFQISFAQPPDLQKYQYVLVFSQHKIPSIKLPVLNSASPPYFPLPGLTFDPSHQDFIINDRTISYYYSTYFNTFTRYILLHRDEAKLYAENTTSFSITSPEDHHQFTYDRTFEYTLSVQGNVMTLKFRPELLYSTILGKPLYFSILTLSIPDTTYESGIIIDQLNVIPQLSVVATETQNNVETQDNAYQDSTSLPAIDITKWRVTLF